MFGTAHSPAEPEWSFRRLLAIPTRLQLIKATELLVGGIKLFRYRPVAMVVLHSG